MAIWQKHIKKAIFTLNLDNYVPKEITDLTYPLIKAWAFKIGAEFVLIDKRKFPDFPPTYEKLQIYQMAQDMQNDWSIYIDSDALIKPELMDLTAIIPRDTVAHHGMDFASMRWRYDRFFLRDGRNIGSGNWFTMASDWCIELWKPLDDMTKDEAIANCFPTADELVSGCIDNVHLIDDYVLSRNIAKYGLKFVAIRQLMERHGFQGGGDFYYHQYTLNLEDKLKRMKEVLDRWKIQ